MIQQREEGKREEEKKEREERKEAGVPSRGLFDFLNSTMASNQRQRMRVAFLRSVIDEGERDPRAGDPTGANT